VIVRRDRHGDSRFTVLCRLLLPALGELDVKIFAAVGVGRLVHVYDKVRLDGS
jgi:hypothetical protein